MKKIFFSIFLLLFIIEIQAQDIIVKTNDERINCLIIQASETQITYKLTPESKASYIGRSFVKELIYENAKKNENTGNVVENPKQQPNTNNNNSYSYYQSNNNLQDVVYLKNGSIIRGVIIEQVPNKALKIQTYDKSVFVYEFEEIEKITKEVDPNKKEEKEQEKKGLSTNYKSRGFNSNFDFGVFVNGTGTSFPIRITIGGYIGKHVQLGVGSGIDIYSDPWVPVYLDLRINVLPYRVTPQFIIQGGYSADVKSNQFFDATYHGGYFSGGLGIKIFFPNNKTAICFAVGDNIQQVRRSHSSYEPIYVNNFYAKMGFQF